MPEWKDPWDMLSSCFSLGDLLHIGFADVESMSHVPPGAVREACWALSAGGSAHHIKGKLCLAPV